jgi:hypothetical protein
MTIADLKSIAADAQKNKLTTTSLLSDQGFASVIADPREYQVELFERAKKENTIAVLDTGLTTKSDMLFSFSNYLHRLWEDSHCNLASEACATT